MKLEGSQSLYRVMRRTLLLVQGMCPAPRWPRQQVRLHSLIAYPFPCKLLQGPSGWRGRGNCALRVRRWEEEEREVVAVVVGTGPE